MKEINYTLYEIYLKELYDHKFFIDITHPTICGMILISDLKIIFRYNQL